MKSNTLGNICSIKNSNIDKKIKEDEKRVKLCNFVNVYYNYAIYNSNFESFMDGSVQYDKYPDFALKRGQVAITKDSETKDDIGMSCYVDSTMENVVLGYHCALLTPDPNFVNGKYLNAYLNSYLGRNQFSNNASGSGQRYTLSIDSIKNINVLLPDLELQEKIGDLLLNIDKKINSNIQINNNLVA